ncbi:MAG: hypothetical protein RJA72_1518 [Pseudomonadota bacterium]
MGLHMYDYLVFDTKVAALDALEAIYANMVESVNSQNLLNVATGQVVQKDELSPDEAVQIDAEKRHFPVFGANAANGAKNTKQGYTTAWADALETLQGKWVFQKPDDSLMDGVVGYSVEPYNPNWFQVGGSI